VITFDIVFVGVVLFFALKGILSGFKVELMNLIGVVGGVFVASRVAKLYSTKVESSLDFIKNEAMAESLLFFVTFASIFLVAKLLTPANNLSFDRTPLSKLGGYLLAVVKYAVVFSIVVSVLLHTPLKSKIEEKTKESRLYQKMRDIGNLMLNERE
jgi:membrane protein required for colicin V production